MSHVTLSFRNVVILGTKLITNTPVQDYRSHSIRRSVRDSCHAEYAVSYVASSDNCM